MIITLSQIAIFFLIMARLVGAFMLAPVFSRKQVFGMVKIALLFWITWLLLFVVPMPYKFPEDLLTYTFAIVAEIFLGMVIGFIMDLIVSAVEFAGTLMDTQAGLSVASLLDPATGRNAAILQQLLQYVAFMVFLIIDGHHLVLSSIVQSFKLLPPGVPINFTKSTYYMIDIATDIFRLGLHLAVPIILIVFMIDFAFGMLNKVAEQINVFQLGFQVKPPISLLILLFVIFGIIESISRIMEVVSEHFGKFMLMTQ